MSNLEKIRTSDMIAAEIKKYQEENKNLKSEINVINSNKKEELVNREVEIENLRGHIKELEVKIKESREVDPEVEEELNLSRNFLQEKSVELGQAYEEIKQLKRELDEKSIVEVNTTIPEEIERELEELRDKVNNSGSKNLSTVKFKIHFEEVTRGFNELITALNGIEEGELKDKYKGAVKRLISGIESKL